MFHPLLVGNFHFIFLQLSESENADAGEDDGGEDADADEDADEHGSEADEKEEMEEGNEVLTIH